MRAWYTHGWNTATSLRLILTIIPRLPRAVVPAVGVATTALCLTSMNRERRAAGRNLRRILGRGGWSKRRAVWSLFYNFARFMVSYCDLPRIAPADLEARHTPDREGDERIREALSRGRGLIVLTAHLGNWEVGAQLLARTGLRVHVAMQVERANAAERWLARARARGAVRVLPLRESPEGILALRAVLARNEILAMQGDRAAGGRCLTVPLFGAPFPLPLGPFLLAYLCDAPLLPAFVLQEGWWRWRSEIGGPIRFPRTGDRDADLTAGAAQYAAALERTVARHPDQWFNFYDLWPAAAR
jgi:KDO2-lipid IV(A) lauroyltransferase